mgnify:CR=1 FL=1
MSILLQTLKEFTAENFKPLVVMLTSIITAHSPMLLFINWTDWLPFLEVLKSSISTIAIIISSIILILNYLKKRKE